MKIISNNTSFPRKESYLYEFLTARRRLFPEKGAQVQIYTGIVNVIILNIKKN